MFMDSKTYPILAGALIVGLVFGYLIGSSGKDQAYNSGLAQGKKEAREKLEEIFPSEPEREEILSISGEIKEIKDKTIVLEEVVYPINPLDEVKITEWQARVVEGTEIIKRTEEMGEEAMPSFKDTEMGFSELKAGQEITIEAGENIKGKTAFDAQRIIYLVIAGP